MDKYHVETRRETLIVTDLETNSFKVLANNGLNRIRFKWFNGEYIDFKFQDNLEINEIDNMIFKVKYREYSHVTEIEESGLIGEIIELALNHQDKEAIEILTEYVETAISNKIQIDLIMYLLGSYSKRLRFEENFIEIDGKYRVYYNATQEVLTVEKFFGHLCLVKRDNEDFQPTWFKIQNQYYVLTKNGCEVMSKILFLLEAENHKNDFVFWKQVKHLYKSNWLRNTRGLET